MAPPRDERHEAIRYDCPTCGWHEAVVTFRRPGIMGLFCVKCECAWTAEEHRHKADRRCGAQPVERERRVGGRRR